MKSILVVGGAGYIGSHTVKHLMQNGYDCVVVDNLSAGHEEAVQTRFFEKINFGNKESLNAVFQKYDIEAVVHFAAHTYVGESVSDPRKYYANNVIGTLNLLDVMLDNKCSKIVFSSTCAVYGEPEYLPLDESHPCLPISPYGKTKFMIEQILKDYHKAYGLKYIALRYFNAAGASSDGDIGESHNPETHLIPLVFQSILDPKGLIKIFGTEYDTEDGTCIRDYVHVEDLALGHRLALEKLEEFNGSINLGLGAGISVKQIIGTAEKISGKECRTETTAARAGDPAGLFADNQLAKKILGWTPKIKNIEDILKTAWDWETNRKF